MANSYDAITLVAKNRAIDICIIGYSLIGETAIDMVAKFKHHKCNTAVIAMTVLYRDKLDLELISNGILDLINKDELSPGVVDRSIRYIFAGSK